MRTSRKVKISIVIVVVLFIAVFIYRYNSVNKDNVKKQYFEYNMGEEFVYNGFTYVVNKSWIEEGQEGKMLVIDMTIRNDKDESDVLELTRLEIESGGMTQGLGADSYMEKNDVPLYSEWEKGQEENVILSFDLVESLFKEKDRKNIENRAYYLVFSIVPDKIVVKVN